MEDAATAEISRSQIWQWIRSDKGVLDDGRKVTADMVRGMVAEETVKVTDALKGLDTVAKAAAIFEDMSTRDDFIEFLTLPLYEEF